MKPHLRLPALAAALGLGIPAASAAPLVSLGDGVNLFFNGSASLQYVDNLFYTPPGSSVENDWIFIVTPGLELRAGRPGSAAQFTLWVENEFKAYVNRGDLDRDNLSIRGQLSYDTDRTKFSARGAFYELDQNTFDIRLPGQMVLREITDVSANVEHRLSAKTSAAIGFGYYQQDFKTPGFRDHESVSVPVNLYYHYSPKLDLSVGYRWRETDVDAGVGSTDHFISVGARGQLLPKVTGTVRIGANRRSPDVGTSDSTLGVETDLTWAATAKTAVNLSLDRDFGTSGGGSSTQSLRTGVNVSHQFSSVLGGYAYVNFTNTEYTYGREDDTFASGFGVSYSPNSTIRLSAGYNYQDNDSSVTGLNYENHILNFSASLRY